MNKKITIFGPGDKESKLIMEEAERITKLLHPDLIIAYNSILTIKVTMEEVLGIKGEVKLIKKC